MSGEESRPSSGAPGAVSASGEIEQPKSQPLAVRTAPAPGPILAQPAPGTGHPRHGAGGHPDRD